MDVINNVYFHSLGLTVLHSLWQGALVGLLYLSAKQLFSSYSADFRFRLTAFAFTGQFVLSTATFLFIIGNSLIPSPNESIILQQIQLDFSSGVHRINWLPILGVAWVFGSVFLLLRLISGHLQIITIKKSSTALSSHWIELMEELKIKLKIEKNIQLLCSSKTIIPFTAGYLKPVIIFPIGLVNQLKQEEVEAIISHELAHIKYDDYLWNLFFSFVEALFYFHPMVWWLSKELNELREERCDQSAIDTLGNRMQYAKTLVRMQDHIHQNTQISMAFSGHNNDFSKRIFKILNQPLPMKKSNNKLIGFLIVGLLSTCLLISSVYANQKNTTDHSSIIINTNCEIETEAIDEQLNLTTITKSTPSIIKENSVNPITATPIKTSFRIATDTIPKKNKKESYTFQYNADGKNTKIKMQNGDITYLKIDGKVIPKSEYGEYKEEVEAIRNAVPPPPPPAPPVPHRNLQEEVLAPPAPPVPSAPRTLNGEVQKSVPTPPRFPNGDIVPPPPPPPPVPPIIDSEEINDFDFEKFGDFNLEQLTNDLENLQFDLDAFKIHSDSLFVFNLNNTSSINRNQLVPILEELEQLQLSNIDQMVELKNVKIQELEARLADHMHLIQEKAAEQMEQVEMQLQIAEEQHKLKQEEFFEHRALMHEKLEELEQLQEKKVKEKLDKLKEKAKKKSKKRKVKVKTR